MSLAERFGPLLAGGWREALGTVVYCLDCGGDLLEFTPDQRCWVRRHPMQGYPAPRGPQSWTLRHTGHTRCARLEIMFRVRAKPPSEKAA